MKALHHSYSQDMERSRIRLPNIHGVEARSFANDNETYENPFYIPPDEEIFKLKNKEKENKELERSKVHSMKIWQKGLKHASAGKLRKINELTKFEEEGEDDDGKLNIVDAARSAIKNRIRHREPLLNFLTKKREMFLFQMSINEKKEQIREYEELAHLQEISLQNSKDLLEKDAETFKQHVEKNKNETRQAIKNAEDETKEKQKKIHEMKQIHEELAAIQSKNTKQLEKLQKFYGYKQFLDKLAPDDFLKAQQKLKAERKLARRSTSNENSPIKDKRKEEVHWQTYNLNLSQGIWDLLNDDDDEGEMYFKESTQLQELFQTLEEKNLFIIKYNQDIEQNIEDLRRNFASKQAILLEKERQLKKNKQDLERAIQQRAKQINRLHVKTDKFTEKTLSKLENAITHIYETCKFLKEGKVDQQVNGFDVLGQIEKKVDWQLKELENLNPQKIFEQYKMCINRRREEVNEQKRKEHIEEQKLKLEIIKKRLMAQKRFGRPIMAKSMLQKEDKEEVDVGVEDEEEIERRLYFTVRFQ